MIGIMDFDKALNLASSRGLDLVLMSEAAIPVVKLGDYNKMLYEQKKKEKESKKHQFVPKLKEIDFGVNIGQNDYLVKIKHILNFLSEKNNVKIVVKMDKRIATNNPKLGYDVIDQILTDLQDECTYIDKPKLLGTNICLTISPIKNKNA